MRFRKGVQTEFHIAKNEGRVGWTFWDGPFKTEKDANTALELSYSPLDGVFRVVEARHTMRPLPKPRRR